MNTTALAYADLKDIDEIEPLSDADLPVLEEIKGVLEKYGMLDRFGVCLLHSHFELREDEHLVETCDPERRELLIKPTPRSDTAGHNTIETMWRFDDAQSSLICFRTCSANGPQGTHKTKHVKGA